MLESIALKKVATYDDTGIQITDLKKVNFIYGANGSGKTTISKVIDNPKDAAFMDCSLNWKNGLPLTALVYNKEFRNRNFGKGSIDGVFTLGQATREEIEEIRRMEIELMAIKDKGIKRKETLEKQQSEQQQYINEFKEEVWSKVYKKNEVAFKEAFKGVMQKEPFKERLLDEFKNNKSILKTYDELKESANTIFGEPPKEMKPLATIDISRILEIETDNIWQKKIIGKTDVEIAKLIQRLNLNDWVNEGRKYLQVDETCPFCQKSTITKEFRKELENYFDESFTNDTKFCKGLADEYNRLVANEINILSGIEVSEKINTESKLEIEKFSAYLKTLSSQLVSNKELLNNKIKEPSRSMDLISVKEQLEGIKELIASANEGIKKHNAIVANFTAERNQLIKSIWKYLIEENRTKIEAFNKKLSGLNTGIDALINDHKQLQADWSVLNKKIIAKNKNVTSVQPSVDEINKTLKSYGFLNFSIIPSKTEKNQYQIQREDGNIAESTLSEGEITFITFLYFLQLSKRSTKEETISAERILVVDDPISSLDSNVLFVVSSLLKEVIKSVKKDVSSIKQLIILTHNVYFHKEVSFIDGRTKENKDTNYWILRKNNNTSVIQKYGLKNPIQSSYELLWQELKVNQSSITTQNTMRRIIENYFKILGKYGDDDLINRFQSTHEQEICRSLICWINDGSHGVSDDLYVEHQANVIEKYADVFKKIFTQMGHSEHYNMMMGEIPE